VEFVVQYVNQGTHRHNAWYELHVQQIIKQKNMTTSTIDGFWLPFCYLQTFLINIFTLSASIKCICIDKQRESQN